MSPGQSTRSSRGESFDFTAALYKQRGSGSNVSVLIEMREACSGGAFYLFCPAKCFSLSTIYVCN